MPLADVRISALDRGFVFGDGVYEVTRIYQNRPWLHQEHIARLARSLKEIRIDCNMDRLVNRMEETLAASKVAEGSLYVQITRGSAPRHHVFPKVPIPPNELIYVTRYPEDPYQELRAIGAKVITQPDLRWSRCDIKSLNLLANVLACQAAAEAGCQESLFVDREGRITEATHSSVFAVKQGNILTTPLAENILPGITRKIIFQLAERISVPVVEGVLRSSEISAVEELFLTGTGIEVVGITEVDGKPIGNGKPGPITRRLEEAYRQAIADWLAKPQSIPRKETLA